MNINMIHIYSHVSLMIQISFIIVLLLINSKIFIISALETNQQKSQINNKTELNYIQTFNKDGGYYNKTNHQQSLPKSKTNHHNNSSNSNNHNNKKGKQQVFVDKNNYEYSSPSLSSLYDFLTNNQNIKNINDNPLNSQAQQLYATPIPLGREHELNINAPSIKNQQLGLGSIPTDFILTPPTSMISSLTDNSQLYSQQMMMPSKDSTQQQDQILASFYANNANNNIDNNNNNLQMINTNNIKDVNDLYGNRPAPNDIINGNVYQESSQSYYNNKQPMMLNNFNNGQEKFQNEQRFSDNSYVDQRSNKKDKLLSNEQLASLIDELKEYHNKQASKLRANILPEHPMKTNSNKSKRQPSTIKSQYPSGHENDIEQGDKLSVSATKNNNNNLDEEQKDNSPKLDMSTEDLAKFAKFLMTKEGSNLKFQLGLDKDAPDDGDEEDHDPLLESKKKTTKTRPKVSKRLELEDMDKKHSEVEAQMDQLISDMSSKLRNNDQLLKDNNNNNKKKRLGNKRFANNKDDDEDDGDQMNERKRRDYNSKESSKQVNNNSTEKPFDLKKSGKVINKQDFTTDSNQDENFAKMLIQKELLEDKQESANDEKSSQPTPPQEVKRKRKKRSKKNHKHINAVQMESSSPVNKIYLEDQNSAHNNYKYPKIERNKDQIALIDELQKSRNKKSKIRFRLPNLAPPSSQSIIKRALDGELGVQTEKHPDGTLILRTMRDGELKLKLPKSKKQAIITNDETTTDYNNSNALEPLEQTNNNNDGQLVESVKFHSPKPIQDEYPISERVSDRLHKLSNNLDKYFNDGFLKEIDAKSRIQGPLSQNNDNNNRKDHHQQSSSNIEESPYSKKKDDRSKLKVDHDFDVDVTIDNKRDPDEDEDEDKEKNDDDDVKVKIKKKKSIDKRARNKPIKVTNDNAAPDNLSLRRDISSRNEKIEFENNGAPFLADPVDKESFESPIGPDNEDGDANLTKKIKSSEESNSSTRMGKKVGTKFYEEPVW